MVTETAVAAVAAVAAVTVDISPITNFTGDFAFLSNFHDVTRYGGAAVDYEGLAFRTVEAAYQAQKTLDQRERLSISKLNTATAARKCGRTVKLRADWDDVKVGIMAELLQIKFSIPEMREMLLGTGTRELVEGNDWHDNWWGRCRCDKCGGKGENMLGQLLEAVRDRLRQ